MNTFLNEVIQQLIAEKGIDHLANTTIVVPSRRAMLHVKDCFKDYMVANNLQGPIQLPRLTTLSVLFDDLSPLYKMDEIQLVCTLYNIYIEVEKDARPNKDQLPLDVFYGWGRQLIQDFSNIDKTYPLVTPEDFLDNTAAAQQLSTLDIDEDVRLRLEQLVSGNPTAAPMDSKRQEFEVIWANLRQIYERFRKALGNYGYEGARMQAVISHWTDESIQRKIAGQHFVFAGFNYLVPAEKKLMQNLEEAGQATFFWDYPTADTFTANSKAFRWIRRNAEFFGNAAKQKDWQPKEVELISTVSSHAQAQYVYQWLLANHHPGDHSAVVICDESVLEQVIYALPQDKHEDPNPRFKHINITKGFPLRQTEIFSRLMAWLDEGKSLDEFIANTVKSLPKNDSANELETATESIQEELIHATFTELLAKESTFQLLSHLTRFKQMQSAGKIPANIPQRTVNILLRRYLSAISFPFHGEPLADVQVTGVLETRAMDFDNILLLNVEEGIVPNVSPDHSYLPYYLRKYYGLQTHEESTDVYAYNFFRLLTRAKKITMTFSGSETGTNRKSMSRFVKQIMSSENFHVTKHLLMEPNSSTNIVPTELPNVLTPVRATKTVFSPSAINMFRQCEMKYFLHYRMGIPEPEQQDALLSHADMGTYVHDAIFELYSQYADIANLPNPIDWSKLNSLKEVADKHPIEWTAIKTYLNRIVEADKQLAKNGLEIQAMETDFYLKMEVPNHGQVSVGGRIDRIDRVGGEVRIVDYKTGKPNDENKCQINIYRLAYKQQEETKLQKEKVPLPKAVLYLCRNSTANLAYEVPLKSEEAFMSELQETVQAILDLGTPKMADKDEKCLFCPYQLLCNRHPKDFT